MIERLIREKEAPHRTPESIYDPERDGVIETEGDPDVLQALIRQAQNVAEGKEDPNIQVGVFVLPGGIRGVSGGGQVTAIDDAGLTNGIKVIAGGSTGSHIAAWMLAGNPRKGTTIFSEECTTSDFIRKKRIVDGYGMDVGYLSQVYRGEAGNKPLDVERIRNAKPDFLIAATEYYTGKGALLDGKTGPIIDKIEASSAAGPLYTDAVYIDDVRYADASAGAYFPIKEVMERYKLTHVIVLANSPRESEESFSSKLADKVLSTVSLPTEYRKGWLKREESYQKSLEFLRKSGIPYLIVYPDNAVDSLTQDAEKIRATAARAEDHMGKLIRTEREAMRKNDASHHSGIETKEGEPKVHTVYAYIQKKRAGPTWKHMDTVLGLYADKEEAMKSARFEDMLADEADVIAPLHVYEREEDLPEAIRSKIRPDNGKQLPMPILEKQEGMVYAVVPNTDSTEGRGESFIWALVTEPELANTIARGNGVSGSNASVVALPLNKFPIADHWSRDVVLRRDNEEGLTDELHGTASRNVDEVVFRRG